jgi:F0F1-type ATP synthase membrane subunit c/vacuolar-type H+-ATPase subunit K
MRTSIGAGIAAGVTVGGAGRAAVELVTETADAQSGRQTLSQNHESQAEGSNLRS